MLRLLLLVWLISLSSEANANHKNQIIVDVDKKYFRPCEVNSLIGDASKANKKLGWVPRTSLEELVADMIKHDKELAKKDKLLKNKGYEVSFPRD